MYEVRPASLSQVLRGRDGRMIVIDDDVCNIVADLQRIDPRFRVSYVPDGHCYWVWLAIQDKDGRPARHFVSSVNGDAFDRRVVAMAERITHESYDVAADMERVQREAERLAAEKRRRPIEENADRLHWAMRRDLRVKDQAFIP